MGVALNSTFAKPKMDVLKKVYEEYSLWMLLDIEGQFQASELGLPCEDTHSVMRRLQSIGAVHVVERAQKNNNSVNVYEFDPAAKEALRQYDEQRTTLPDCNHRVHVHHEEDGSYGCQFCDESRDYSREQILEGLNGD